MRPLIFLLLLSVSVPALAEQTASQRLERLVAEAQERAFDLYPFGETMGKGAGPRQDKVELTFSDEHRERQRVHNRWILQELAAIGANELNTSEKLTRALLERRSRESLEWLSHPFHQHSVLIQMDGGLGTTLIKLSNTSRATGTKPSLRQPMTRDGDRRRSVPPIASRTNHNADLTTKADPAAALVHVHRRASRASPTIQ